MSGFGSFAHLARRFVGALGSQPPDPDDEAWALDQLGAGEQDLWRAMDAPDRRHAVGVARTVAADLGDDATRPVLAAALLHDVGKIVAGLGTLARVGATVVATAVGRERAANWAASGGVRGRIGDYVIHDRLGAGLLAAAGAAPLTVTWAREHHLPADRWTLPVDVAAALHAADDD